MLNVKISKIVPPTYYIHDDSELAEVKELGLKVLLSSCATTLVFEFGHKEAYFVHIKDIISEVIKHRESNLEKE